MGAEERETIAAAKRGVELARSRVNGPVLVYPSAAGFDWAFGVPRYSRDTWHLRHYIRPYDETMLLTRVDELAGVVILDTPHSAYWLAGPFVERLRSDRAFSPEVVRRIEARFTVRIRLSNHCQLLLPEK